MIKYRGVREEKIGDKTVFFKHDLQALTMLGDMQNIGVNEIIKDCGRAKLSTLAAFLYCGAYRYWQTEKKVNDKGIDFTLEDATEWLDESNLGLVRTLGIVTDCFETPKYEVKNDKATPKEIGTSKTPSPMPSESVA